MNEEFLAGAGIAVETLTLGSNGAIKQAARAGLGVSFVSRDAVANELDAGLLGVIPVASCTGCPSVVCDALGRRNRATRRRAVHGVPSRPYIGYVLGISSDD